MKQPHLIILNGKVEKEKKLESLPRQLFK